MRMKFSVSAFHIDFDLGCDSCNVTLKKYDAFCRGRDGCGGYFNSIVCQK